MKKEAHLSGGRMPTLNKEMGLQDAYTLLSVNDKQSTKPAPDGLSFHAEDPESMPKINKMTSNVSTHRFIK